MSNDNTVTVEDVAGDFQALLLSLRTAKPEERNELARRYAIVITEVEKAMGYFIAFIAAS